jgi:phospholipid-binding lipoprotein MlaA
VRLLKSIKRPLFLAAVLLTMTLLAGCATSIPAAPKEERAATDPWEPMNRRVDAFNNNVDRFTLKPLAKGYATIFPDFMRRGINNAFNNLRTPLYMINNLLQGKIGRSASETGRLLVNSTIGIGGLFNVADEFGMDTYNEDFGQTFAVWGVSDGPYVVVPFLGPRTLRGVVSIPFNYAADPISYIDHDQTRLAVRAADTINTREQLFAAEALIENSFDRYLAIRESYLQNRNFLIYDGDPPEDEDFYDDFEDPDEFGEETQ